MRSSSTTFYGPLFEFYGDPSQGLTPGSRTKTNIRRTESLSNVISSNNIVNGRLVRRNAPHSYQHDVGNGRYGFYNESLYRTNGTSYYYNKQGDFGVDGSFIFHPDLGSYNDALSSLSDIIRGGIDLSIDAFQIAKTVNLAKRILSARKIVEHLARKTWKDTSAERRRYSRVARDRVYKHKRSRRDRYDRIAVLNNTPMKDVGGLYLEFTYGLKPTLQTIYDLSMGNAVRTGNSLNIKKPGSRFNGASGSFDASTVDNSQGLTTRYNNIYESSYRTKIGGYYTPSSSYIESLSRLTSLNPVSIAWELLPFSFVVDWFYDVGGYLRMAETSLVSNLGTFNGFLSSSIRHRVRSSEIHFGKDAYGYTKSGNIVGGRYRQSFKRSVISSVPFPRPPSFKADLGSHRLINAAALLSQFIGRSR